MLDFEKSLKFGIGGILFFLYKLESSSQKIDYQYQALSIERC